MYALIRKQLLFCLNFKLMVDDITTSDKGTLAANLDAANGVLLLYLS